MDIQSMEFSSPEPCSGYAVPSPGDLFNPGIEPGSPPLQADSLPSEPPGKPILSIDKIKTQKFKSKSDYRSDKKTGINST